MMMWNYTVKYEKVLKRILSEIKMADYKYHMNPILILKCVYTHKNMYRESLEWYFFNVNNGSLGDRNSLYDLGQMT